MNNLKVLLTPIRRYVDSITMYRVVLYGLLALVGVVLAWSVLGIYTAVPVEILLLTLFVLSVVSFVTNMLFARLFKIATNLESSIITTMILFFVLAPPSAPLEWAGIALAAFAAIASKYLITWRSAHIFNPAALGTLAVSAVGIGSGAWWIANELFFIPMLVVGALVLYKLRSFGLFFAFAIPAVVLIVLRTFPGSTLDSALTQAVTLFPILFLGTIMLTEPHTMPTARYDRLLFGALVGVVFASTVDFGFISSSPELALLIGNVFALAVTSRTAMTLNLVDKKQLTPTTLSFRFKPDKQFNHAAGQYMEVTLPGLVHDARGNRRTFSIVSSPGDEFVEIGVKFYEPGSSFKKQLRLLEPGDHISASNIAGEFTLPNIFDKPIVLVAGGIGITPFVSMIRDLSRRSVTVPIVLYYFVSDSSEVAYNDVLTLAIRNGIQVHIREGRGKSLSIEDIQGHPGATYYLSGPPGMVGSYRTLLKKSGIHRIHTDYFTGY